jgi:transposase InsO family protein/transposase-like protein
MGARGGVAAAGFPEGDPAPEDDGGWEGVPGEPGYPGSPGGAAAEEADRRLDGRLSKRPASSRRFTPAEKLELMRAYEDSGKAIEEFCRANGVTSASLCKWRRQFASGGSKALEPKPLHGNRTGRTRRPYTPEERRQAIEAYEQSGLSLSVFTVMWGVSAKTFLDWRKRYEETGPKGLEPRKRGPRQASGFARRIPATVAAEIVETKKKFPWFGLRKLKDFLFRFRGMKVSPGGVGATLDRAGVPRAQAKRRRRVERKGPPNRWARESPMILWQSDITSVYLGRMERRVYLTVYLDDCSRFVVSFALNVHQRQDLVMDALREGIIRYGKPKEVLTDQGRQYYAWRGKSQFDKLLDREGIRHIKSRPHHPETVGKCERLWETLEREFWSRCKPEDLIDARERLARYLAHYNFFRPHSALGGMTPADRFFGAEEAVRRTLEAKLTKDELRLSLSDPPRKSVYVFGQVGERQLSLHGERGKLVIQTPDGECEEMAFDEFGVEQRKEKSDGRDDGIGGGVGRDGGVGAAPTAGKETAPVPAARADAARGEGPVDVRDGGGAGACAPDDGGDAAGVDGEADPAGSRGEARDPAGEAPPALPAGDGRDAGGTAPPAASEKGDADDPGEAVGGSDVAQGGESPA